MGSLTASLFAMTYHMNCKKSHQILLSDFDACLEQMKKYSILIEHTFELDSNNNLHLHATVMSNHSNLFRKTFVKGYNHTCVIIHDYEGWHRYINKDQKYDQNNDNGFPIPKRIIPYTELELEI